MILTSFRSSDIPQWLSGSRLVLRRTPLPSSSCTANLNSCHGPTWSSHLPKKNSRNHGFVEIFHIKNGLLTGRFILGGWDYGHKGVWPSPNRGNPTFDDDTMVWWVKHITSETQWWTIPMSSALGIYEIVPLLVAGNPSNIVWEFSFSILSTIPYRMELLDMYQCSKPLFFFTGYKHYTDIIHTLYIHYT